MALTTAFCTSLKEGLFSGLNDFGNSATSPIGGDVFKLVLVKATPTGTYGAASTNYTDITGNTDEAVDTASPQGYSAGGGTLTNAGRATTSTTCFVDFADITFTAVTLSADGCMIINSTNSNSSCSVHDFGGTKTASGGNFVVQFPTADSSSAVLRLA